MLAFRKAINAILWSDPNTFKVSTQMREIDAVFKSTSIPFPIASAILESEISDRRKGYHSWSLEYDLWCSYVRHADKSVDDRLYALGNVAKAYKSSVPDAVRVPLLERYIKGVIDDRN